MESVEYAEKYHLADPISGTVQKIYNCSNSEPTDLNSHFGMFLLLAAYSYNLWLTLSFCFPFLNCLGFPEVFFLCLP